MSKHPNVSADLIWEIVRSQNAYLVKRRSGGGVQFSRDPLNLSNNHSRKHAGFVNDKAVGVQSHEKGGVHLMTKKAKKSHQPANHHHTAVFGKGTSNKKTYKGIANHVAKASYRADLNGDAIARASAIRNSQREKKETPEKKLRGAKARKAAVKE